MSKQIKPFIESNNFIILNEYNKKYQSEKYYQSEEDLEKEFIADLENQGYEFVQHINNQNDMLQNVRIQLENLNDVKFLDSEWSRFVEEYLDKVSENIIDKTRKIHDDYKYDFIFDNGCIKNISLLNKKNIHSNKLQVIKQFEQTGKHVNRYDVTILINGLPLIQIELKNVVLLFARLLIKYIDIVKRVLIVKILFINIYKFLLFLMVQIAVILLILQSEIKIALILQ